MLRVRPEDPLTVSGWRPDQAKRLVALAVIPRERRGSCYNCGNLRGIRTWWCGDREAVKARGDSLPDDNGCPRWQHPGSDA